MLFTNTAAAFSKLCEVLKKTGVKDEVLETMREYLDTEKERNNELLNGLETFQTTASFNWQLREEANKAVSKDIVKGHDTELMERFTVFMFALMKSSCHFFIPQKLTKLQSGANVFDPKAHFEAIAESLGGLLGEDAEAAAYAANIEYAFYNGGLFRQPSMKSQAVCAAAIKYLNPIMNTQTQAQHYISAKLLLCCYVLEQEPRNGGALSPEAARAIELIRDQWHNKDQLIGDAYSFLMCATAEAAHFESKAAARFGMSWKDLERPTVVVASGMITPLLRVFEFIESREELVTGTYIGSIAKVGGRLADRQQRLERLAAEHPKAFKQSIGTIGDDAVLAKDMGDIMLRANPELSAEFDYLALKNRHRLAQSVTEQLGGKKEVDDYIMGRATLKEAREAIKGWCVGGGYGGGFNYYGAYGIDEYLARAYTIMMLADYSYGRMYRIDRAIGFMTDKREKDAFKMLSDCGLPLNDSIEAMARCIDDMYARKEEAMDQTAAAAAEKAEELEKLDVSKLSATGRIIAVEAMGRDAQRFKTQLQAEADDGSKAVRAELVDIFAKADWREEVCSLLKAKKAAKRELALGVIEAQGADSYRDELAAAFESEKSDKIKLRIGALIGIEAAAVQKKEKQLSLDEQIAALVKPAKVAKLGYLFASPIKPVHKADGTEAPEEYLKALVMCYSGMTSPARSRLADEIAAQLDQNDLAGFAAEMFGRWFDNGAQAKQKGVLYFCAIHGGAQMVRDLMHYIKEWSEMMRGAIAAEAVRAMALNGSSEALMNVDSMSRKFKNKQVRSAAAEALASAAETLGITTEELADRIVPDLGFDSRLCRVFDYGKRQFSVYLKPTMELEIFAGEKQVKNLPKPGTTDDKEKAEAAYGDFKEMKKQLKTVVAAQKARLEYVLMCDRKWSAESWRTLFVDNAVMHCFAVGLIWGVYENGALKSTFRYMDDGSFTTADEEEFDLPEGAQIGLVHPLELVAEQLDIWKEQLKDYEITQPFDQLGRQVYRPDQKELAEQCITRFEGDELNSLALIGKMTKLGWYKGQAEDAGVFYYFYRLDPQRRVTAPDGTVRAEGSGAMLVFSGASIAAYDFEGEDVTLGELVFSGADKVPDYYDKERRGWMKISDVSPRYFSEIMLSLEGLAPARE
ncbi:MAG: DUF4132 domain-containing protein [Ruminococcus sp.]|nr:DUF4132 domain-containing protein [Ruminococcus sp.]